MRRALATFLMLAVSFPLIAAMTLAGDASLPECCRRAGKHHCAMAEDSSSAGDPGLRAGARRCASFPGAALAIGNAQFAVLDASAKIFAAIVSNPAIQIQTAARRRVAVERSSQKRGPPALLS